ncbi:hypothetical protein FANTH_13670 [Fusarium anthophilum]|uniref:Heterokaryon incompatibility domain-containing protein n=1 Tax=Fusarium anthophilum TaxID=48485 RepID=A0A8H4YMB6_9HYPO|nr:hypothetical protein FANTH_13670 [Fusarium anthophilum]
MQPNPTCYTKCEIASGQIRLLQVEQCVPGLPLTCRLSSVTLTAAPTYTALSYMWGDHVEKSNIVINGFTTAITKSLESALRALECYKAGRKLWIDQICINQNSSDEKSFQIPLMGDIYALAEQSVSWLGESNNGSDKAMDILDQYGTASRTGPISTQYGSLMDGSVLEVLLPLFNRPYFSRGWIIQEIAIPARILFQCGSRAITESNFTTAVTLFYSQFQSLVSDYSRTISLPPDSSPVTPIPKNVQLIATPLELMLPAIRTREAYQDIHRRHELTMISLIRRFSMGTTKFTELQDRIFGFAGIAHDAQELGLKSAGIYSDDWVRIYTHITGRMCERNETAILEHVQWPKSNNALPSWVPDFSVPQYPRLRSSTQSPAGSQSLSFSAGGASDQPKSRWEFDNSYGQISFSALLVDDIRDVGSLCGGDAVLERHSAIDLAQYFTICSEVEYFCQKSTHLQQQSTVNIYPSLKRAGEASWRTLTFDRELVEGQQSKQRASERTMRGYYQASQLSSWVAAIGQGHSFSQTIPLTPELEMELAAVPADKRVETENEMRLSRLSLSRDALSFTASLQLLQGKKPFLTKHGFVGIGQGDIRVGDSICVAHGLDVPFILRTFSKGAQKWYFKGEAYCDGIMDGEAWGMNFQEFRAVLV